MKNIKRKNKIMKKTKNKKGDTTKNKNYKNK